MSEKHDLNDEPTETLMKRGIFVVFEGLDRCGKSTQIKNTLEYLKLNNIDCVELTFPDRTTLIGKQINDYLQNKNQLNDETIHLLYSLNRWEKKEYMINTLKSGKTIICSRYAYSGVAYSSAKKGMNFKWCQNVDAGLPCPDLVIYFKVSSEIVSKRGDFGKERYDKIQFQKKVGDIYETIIKQDKCKVHGDNVFKVIECGDSSIEEVKSNVIQALNEAMKKKQNQEIGVLWKNVMKNKN